jgi:hypothetical protein
MLGELEAEPHKNLNTTKVIKLFYFFKANNLF